MFATTFGKLAIILILFGACIDGHAIKKRLKKLEKELKELKQELLEHDTIIGTFS